MQTRVQRPHHPHCCLSLSTDSIHSFIRSITHSLASRCTLLCRIIEFRTQIARPGVKIKSICANIYYAHIVENGWLDLIYSMQIYRHLPFICFIKRFYLVFFKLWTKTNEDTFQNTRIKNKLIFMYLVHTTCSRTRDIFL